ncbi:hypothetical protein ABIB83_002758 [Bradyrhizobium sp. I1.8.5]|uniref:hypothetical protein n=1 Tax=Bradyrhizobium sp. I1.8.5 TaxID=3156365 RepID=UPI003390907A
MIVNLSWKAHEALSWGMYGDETQLSAALKGEKPFQPCRRSMDVARRELRDAIACGSVTARGFMVRSRPSTARERISSDLFDGIEGLAVDIFGETTFMHPASPQNIASWTGIVFNQEEIQSLWPRTRADLDQWMRAAAATRPNDKREARIQDCVSKTGCTFKEAIAAHNRLPQHMKRARGKRIRASTCEE